MVPQDGSSALDQGKARPQLCSLPEEWSVGVSALGAFHSEPRGAAVQESLLRAVAVLAVKPGAAAAPHQSWLPLQLPEECRQCWGFVPGSAVPAPPHTVQAWGQRCGSSKASRHTLHPSLPHTEPASVGRAG